MRRPSKQEITPWKIDHSVDGVGVVGLGAGEKLTLHIANVADHNGYIFQPGTGTRDKRALVISHTILSHNKCDRQ